MHNNYIGRIYFKTSNGSLENQKKRIYNVVFWSVELRYTQMSN